MAAAYTTKSAEEENLWNCACCATFWKFPRGKLHQGAYSTTNVDSNAATAIRTGVVLVLAWLIVLCRREAGAVKQLRAKDVLFLVLSGLATGASWLCYYYAIAQGQVSIVVPIDRLSILVTVLFSVAVLKERLSARAWTGLALLTAGSVALAFFGLTTI